MQRSPGSEPGEAEVEGFLRRHPDFLAERPALLDVMRAPRRVHGEALADHMEARLDRARERAAAAEHALAGVAAERRGVEGFTRRVQEAVLALMRSADPAAVVSGELAGTLRLDAARLCSEATQPPLGAASVPPGTVARALGRARAVLRPAVPDPTLHGEAAMLAGQEGLLLVPLASGPALLALACRDGQGLAGATVESLGFLGAAIGAALDGDR